MSTDLVCVDLSHWQDTVDFEQLKSGGVLGVILKATEGLTYSDPTFRDRCMLAKAAGLAVSSYHFLKPDNPTGQMDFYSRYVCAEPGDRLVIDYEDPLCHLDDLKEAAAYLESRGFQVTIYGANGFLGAQLKGKRDEQLARYDLWVASYTTKDVPTTTDLAATWPVWALWQFTDKAIVEGVVGGVDGNRFNGDDEVFLAWMAPATLPPELLPEDEDLPTITITVESDRPVNVRVVVVTDSVTLVP